MSEIVNLRRARKQRAREEAAAKAAANRVAHGRTKAEKTLTKAEQEAAQKHIEGHKRETDD